MSPQTWGRRFVLAAAVLALALAATLVLPMSEDSEAVSSGKCGDDLSWALDDEGNLTISGSGPMYDYDEFEVNLHFPGLVKTATIGYGTTYIGQCAFAECTSLRAVSIPGSVTSIGSAAFWNCQSLGSVTIPGSVTSIGAEAFASCISLESVALPDSLTSIDAGVFGGCQSLESVTIPGSVTSIGAQAFASCISLESVTIPGSMTSIGSGAFKGCANLQEVQIPETLKRVGDCAFYGCGLASLTIPGDGVIIEHDAFSECKALADIGFTGSGAVIGTKAFYGDNSVSSVDLSGVASIGFKAFPYCYGLESLTIPGCVHDIGGYSFYKCSNLRELSVEEGVKVMSRSAFSECRALESISLPHTLETIGKNAFYGLRFMDPDDIAPGRVYQAELFSVGSVSYAVTPSADRAVSAIGYDGPVMALPSTVSYGGQDYSVVSVCMEAFLRLGTIKSVDLSNVRVLGFKALGNCTGITEITFGEGLEEIGDYALYGLSFYDGATRLKATPDNLRGHTFSGSGAKLYLVS